MTFADRMLPRAKQPWRRAGVRLRTFTALAIPYDVASRDERAQRYAPGCANEAIAVALDRDLAPRVVWFHNFYDAAARRDVEYGEVTGWRDTDVGLVLDGVTCLPVEPGWFVSVEHVGHVDEDVITDVGVITELSLLGPVEGLIPGARVLTVAAEIERMEAG